MIHNFWVFRDRERKAILQINDVYCKIHAQMRSVTSTGTWTQAFCVLAMHIIHK